MQLQGTPMYELNEQTGKITMTWQNSWPLGEENPAEWTPDTVVTLVMPGTAKVTELPVPQPLPSEHQEEEQ